MCSKVYSVHSIYSKFYPHIEAYTLYSTVCIHIDSYKRILYCTLQKTTNGAHWAHRSLFRNYVHYEYILYTYNKQIKSYYYFLKSEMIFNCKKRYCCFLRFFFGENPRRCGLITTFHDFCCNDLHFCLLVEKSRVF